MKRTSVQYVSAMAMLTSGVILSFLGFFTPPEGEISDSVLWYVAQSLIYAGSIFGVGIYFDKRLREVFPKPQTKTI